jgi:hypothetical protein
MLLEPFEESHPARKHERVPVDPVEEKKYAGIPVAGDIFKALQSVEERTGTDFPLADLLSDDPEKSLLSGVTSGGQVGLATIDGVRCRHFSLHKRRMTWSSRSGSKTMNSLCRGALS